MTPEEERLALIRAIVLHPDDLRLRLIYADWLDEFGTTAKQRRQALEIRRGYLVARYRSGVRSGPFVTWLSRQHGVVGAFGRVYRGPFMEYAASDSLNELLSLARRHPLRAVAWTLKDAGWPPSWVGAPAGQTQGNFLPREIIRYVGVPATQPPLEIGPGQEVVCPFTTPEDAFAALSSAVLRYAREGL
jgi:uncharacterized protein (TIGR02996 family)